jgi:hypothetical protein
VQISTTSALIVRQSGIATLWILVTMKCKKRKYRDEIAAKLVMADTARKDHRREKNEIRTYYCRYCRGYHLTSQPFKVKVS